MEDGRRAHAHVSARSSYSVGLKCWSVFDGLRAVAESLQTPYLSGPSVNCGGPLSTQSSCHWHAPSERTSGSCSTAKKDEDPPAWRNRRVHGESGTIRVAYGTRSGHRPTASCRGRSLILNPSLNTCLPVGHRVRPGPSHPWASRQSMRRTSTTAWPRWRHFAAPSASPWSGRSRLP